jgi:hypothetical protein
MGVEFTRKTDEQRQQVETFLQTLMSSGEPSPELLVEPDGMEPVNNQAANQPSSDDPMLELFRTKATLPTAEFQEALCKQRSGGAEAHTASA